MTYLFNLIYWLRSLECKLFGHDWKDVGTYGGRVMLKATGDLPGGLSKKRCYHLHTIIRECQCCGDAEEVSTFKVPAGWQFIGNHPDADLLKKRYGGYEEGGHLAFPKTLPGKGGA